MTAQPSTLHPAFEWQTSRQIDALNLTVEVYRHRRTGAMHYHLAADFDENVFLVALRTMPKDSTGVAHILEHTALCGSERYPVRDPFFMMLRRSLNTFMNAFTSADWTAYPFASQNRKDFDNLLQVYLDAVFHSKLDPLDFAQEGHRMEFAEADNPDSELVFKGVVFNEMKGAMSSVPSTLWHTLGKYLYPTTTYHYNSGGDPEHIPDLSYEQLLHFYRSHYHPSNAIFMTFGDIPAHQHQARFEELALKDFKARHDHIAVPDEKRYHAPMRALEHYPWTEDTDCSDKTHIVVGWLLGKSTELDDLLEAQLLAAVLMDNSSSPLLHALETTTLGSAPSPLCGMEDSLRELCLVCGVEGSRPEHTEAVEQLVLDTLRRVADEGIPREQVEAMLHQLELQHREIGGDHYPYGLQLIMNSLAAATHRGDPVTLLDIDPAIARLREAIQDPDYIPALARRLLLDNPHRVTLTLVPDRDMSARRDAAEAARLAAIKAQLDDSQRQAIVEQTHALQARQNQEPDLSLLPKVGLEDVKPDIHEVHGERRRIGALQAACYARGTNGLAYQQLVMPVPALDAEQLALLPAYTDALTEVGIGGDDYLTTQAHQAAVCGGITAYSTLRSPIDDPTRASAVLVLASKALARNHEQQSALMRDTLDAARFDELPRLRDLVAQRLARREQGVTGNGHMLAAMAASAGFGPVAQWSHEWAGLGGLKALRQLDASLRDDSALQAYGARLWALHRALLGGDKQLLQIAEPDMLPALAEGAAQHWPEDPFARADAGRWQPEAQPQPRRELWVVNTQVNFCARAYPTVAIDHPDCAALTVLGGYLRNGYLHRAVREQGGAYGGGASQDSNTGSFRFYSYRDPRLDETLGDFDAALRWLLQEPQRDEQLEEAILGVLGSLDKPGSPAGEAKQDFHNRLFGRDPEQRRRFRQRVLAVGIDDLRRVAETWLTPERASSAVLTSPTTARQRRAAFEAEGWTLRYLEGL